jgi:tetratricopeptide (TPR) repeat protein
LLDTAKNDYDQDQFVQAQTKYQLILSYEPDNIAAIEGILKIYYQQVISRTILLKTFRATLIAFLDDCAITISSHPKLLAARAKIYRQLKLPNEAISDLQAWQKLKPHNISAQVGLATVYYEQKEFDHASHMIKNILSTNKENIDALTLQAYITYDEGQNADLAFERLSVVLDKEPDNHLARKKRELCMTQVNDLTFSLARAKPPAANMKESCQSLPNPKKHAASSLSHDENFSLKKTRM